MILSEVIKLKNSTITNKQRIIIQCDECDNIWDSSLLNQQLGFQKYYKDLCRSCKNKQQYKEGIRNSNKLIQYNKSLKNKTLEEILGIDGAIIAKEKNSTANSGKNNANFGGKYSHGWASLDQNGKTIEQIWGEETGKRLRQHYSESRKGDKNNMYGKPSPQGSGNGWSGWYKGWFFRSLKELSYMIYVIERFNLKWEGAEKKKYKIEYIDYNGNKRTYYPDFLIEDKFLIEIKPKKLWNSDTVARKKEAAEVFCKQQNFKYKLTECVKQVSFEEIKNLIEDKKLIFTERYNKKFIKYETHCDRGGR